MNPFLSKLLLVLVFYGSNGHPKTSLPGKTLGKQLQGIYSISLVPLTPAPVHLATAASCHSALVIPSHTPLVTSLSQQGHSKQSVSSGL